MAAKSALVIQVFVCKLIPGEAQPSPGEGKSLLQLLLPLIYIKILTGRGQTETYDSC